MEELSVLYIATSQEKIDESFNLKTVVEQKHKTCKAYIL
jgi:hypothetical protein